MACKKLATVQTEQFFYVDFKPNLVQVYGHSQV